MLHLPVTASLGSSSARITVLAGPGADQSEPGSRESDRASLLHIGTARSQISAPDRRNLPAQCWDLPGGADTGSGLILAVRPLDMAPAVPKCLRDPLSVAGLKRLQSDRPRDWHVVVGHHLPPVFVLAADTGVSAALEVGVLDREALRTRSPDGFRQHRAAAALASRLAGKLRIDEIDDDALQNLRRRQESIGHSSDRITRTLGVLRRLHAHWAAEVGLQSLSPLRPTHSAQKAPTPISRPLWTPAEVHRLLAVLRDRGARVAVGLAVGCGLTAGEIEAVQYADLQKHRVLVFGTDRTNSPRVMPTPSWLEALIADHVQHWRRAGRPVTPWLLPSPRDPRRPRRGYSRLLQSAQQRTEGLDHLPPATLRDLRRTWQWFTIHGGLPEGVVRGTWRVEAGSYPTWYPRLQQLVRVEWTHLRLDPERFPRCANFVRSGGALVPSDLAEARRKLAQEPPPLPAACATGSATSAGR